MLAGLCLGHTPLAAACEEHPQVGPSPLTTITCAIASATTTTVITAVSATATTITTITTTTAVAILRHELLDFLETLSATLAVLPMKQ